MKFFLTLLFLVLVVACGGAPAPQATQQPQPTPGPTPTPTPGGKTSFADAQKIMQTYCIECHASAGFIKNEQALVASSAKARVQNTTMPPPYSNQMSAGDKQKFLGFF
jgi:hypothetical protein